MEEENPEQKRKFGDQRPIQRSSFTNLELASFVCMIDLNDRKFETPLSTKTSALQ
jgi:hypothetical protein